MNAGTAMNREYALTGGVAHAAIECRRIIRQHASAAAAAGVVPIVGADIVAELLIATTMVNRIRARFGLTRDQIAEMDVARNLAVMQAARQHGSVIVGRIATGKALASLMARSGESLLARRVPRFVPFVGTAVSAGIGYAAMRAIGIEVLNQCLRVYAAATATNAGGQ